MLRSAGMNRLKYKGAILGDLYTVLWDFEDEGIGQCLRGNIINNIILSLTLMLLVANLADTK